MISRREALKKILCYCAALTSSIPSVARAKQNAIWGSLISFRSSPPSQDVLAGVRIAIDEINSEGGVLERKIEHIIYEGSDQTSAENFIRKLLFQDKAEFIGAGFPPSASEQVYRILCSNKTLWPVTPVAYFLMTVIAHFILLHQFRISKWVKV